MKRRLAVAMLLLNVACARRPDLSAMAEPLFTGSLCNAPRVKDELGTGWREVRGSGFTYCVPSDVVPKGGDGKYWESKSVRFAWSRDPRVTSQTDKVPFMIADRRITPMPGPDDDRSFTDLIDGRQAKMSVQKSDNYHNVACEFESAAVRYFARSTSAGNSKVLLAICKSIRFAAR